MAQWDAIVDAALAGLASRRHLYTTRPILLAPPPALPETFPGPGPWDRAGVEIRLDRATLRRWLAEDFQSSALHRPSNGPSTRRPLLVALTTRLVHLGGDDSGQEEELDENLILFSGNDYLGLGMHPATREATAKAAQEYGMGPRGSALGCGYTSYHKLVEDSLAELKKKEGCLLCPTGVSANMAVMSALGSITSILAVGTKPTEHERVAIFSDALNHASIIDGIRIVERTQEVVSFVYKHCDMSHLDFLLSSCSMEKKVVVTDSLFSMDGDFAPLPQLVELRRKYGFLLVVDDAHGTLVCGDNGGGAPEMFDCENEVDIVVGTLSKGAGSLGGFVACSNPWRRLIESRGRSFGFSTALPVPVVASVLAALHVSKKEQWRRSLLWSHVKYFASLTKLDITSPIICIEVGSEDEVLRAGRHMLRSGFHVLPVRPPTVPPNTCRLRITLTASHSTDDIKRLVDALSPWLPHKHAKQSVSMGPSKL